MRARRNRVRPEDINAALAKSKGPVSGFIAQNYRHFNAAALMDAAKGYETHLGRGGKMLVAMAGAMSTAELGIALAEMIRQDKVHAIVCTGPTSRRISSIWSPTTTMSGSRTIGISRPRRRRPCWTGT